MENTTENTEVATESTESVDQAAAQTDQPSGEQKPKSDVPDWAVRRFGELTAARKEAERRATQASEERDALRRQLSGSEGQQEHAPIHPNVEALARSYAQEIATQQTHQNTLNQQMESIESAGKKEFGDGFDRSIDNLRLAGVGGAEFLQVLANVPNPEKIIQFLGQSDNLDEALRVASLPAYQMGIEMMKLAPKASKAFAKSVSGAPAPISAIDGGGSTDGAEPKLGTPEWFAYRNQNARRK